jgi:diguanylate cyclase (GGDEF)-like protein
MKKKSSSARQLIETLIADQFGNVEDRSPGILLFNSHKTDEIFSIIDSTIEATSSEPVVLRYTCNGTVSDKPLWPLVPAVIQLARLYDINIESLLNDDIVFPSKQPVFRALFNESGLDHILEEPIIEEIGYVKEEILDSFIRLLVHVCSQGPVIILIKNLHLASGSLLSFINRVHLHICRFPLVIACSLDRFWNFTGMDQASHFDQFLHKFEDVNHIYEPDLSDSSSPNPGPIYLSEPVSIDDISVLLTALQYQIHLLLLEEALNTLALIEKTLELSSEPAIDNTERFLFYTYAAMVHYYLWESDNAMQYIRLAITLSEQVKNNRWIAETYARQALVISQKNNIITAERLSSQSIKFARQESDNNLLNFCYFINFCLCDYQSTMMNNEWYESLVNWCETNKLERYIIHIFKDSYFYIPYYKSVKTIHLKIDTGIAIAKRQRNMFALAMFYHKKGILYSYNGDYKNTLTFLKKSEKIRSTLGQPIEIVRICNGIGYYYFIQENYKKANDYFIKASSMIFKARNFNEICMTLYNFAQLYYITRDFYRALAILEKIANLMNQLQIQYIPFRSLADVYMLKAYCHNRNGEKLKSLDFKSRAERMNLSLNSDSEIYRFMIEGFNALDDNKPGEATDLFSKAVNSLDSKIKSQEIYLPFYLSECAIMFRKSGFSDDSVSWFDKAEKCSRETGYSKTGEWIKTCRSQSAVTLLMTLKDPAINHIAIEELAKKEVTVNQLHSKINNIDFLHRLQNLIKGHFTRETVSSDFLELVNIYFPAECGAVFLVKEDDESKCLAANCDSIHFSEKSELVNHCLKIQEAGLIHVTDEERKSDGIFNGIRSLIHVPFTHGTGLQFLLIFTTHRNDLVFRSDDLDVLKIAANQLQFLFQRIDYEEQLIHISNTDELTGVGNRKSLQSRLDEEVRRIKRYGPKTRSHLSIAFIDLDNFKNYNDKYGHDVGDMILQVFTSHLVSLLRDTDFVARYGGDEFIVMMTETDIKNAVNVADRIIESLESKKIFTNKLHQDIESDIADGVIPAITTSIGLAELYYDDIADIAINDVVNMILKNADNALYRAKECGKSCYMV